MSTRGKNSPVKRRLARYWPVGAVAALVVLGAALAWQAATPPVSTSGPGMSSATVVPVVARRETRPTLDPGRFAGKAALAHRVAREIPDVLDQLDCYCGCQMHAGHRSLLSCYTDGHAAT